MAIWRVLRRAGLDRLRGGHDWDLASLRRVARGARAYRTRPAATAADLDARDSANSTRTLTRFLGAAKPHLVHCRTPSQVSRILRQAR
ncbi:hypothetical protein [Actinoplanes sp. NPDC048796]|uniref:hypothetical protein n=1 Tax=Actinoplanes sp. NPDC048796 TaxID=3155640 RepID=UPI0033E44A87